MRPQLSTDQAVLVALGLTAALVVLHLAAPRIRRLPLVPESATGSFAGGLAVAYVFLHLLPEVAAGNEAIGKALDDVVEPTPLLGLGIFEVALLGFVAFFALQRSPTAPAPPGPPTPRDRPEAPQAQSLTPPPQPDKPGPSWVRAQQRCTGCTWAASWSATG